MIRGNISEIKTLALGSGTTKGVDADAADKATEENLDKTLVFAKDFARRVGRYAGSGKRPGAHAAQFQSDRRICKEGVFYLKQIQL